MSAIPILLDEEATKSSIVQFVEWNLDKAPHAVIFGQSGSGKTYFSKLLLGKLSLHMSNSQIYLADFKNDGDFKFLSDCSRFYPYTKSAEGLNEFYARFLARQNGEDLSRNRLIFFFDEWAAYLNSIIEDKKQQEAEKRKLANLLMLGRSFRMHVIVSQQRVDAQYFQTSRDNFSLVVGLGNLSEESKNMFFHEFKKEIRPDRKQGTGYMLTNGTNLTPVTVPKVTHFEKLHNAIVAGVTR
ncbi:FtsK/SpoIIIE family protein [compost metagenome]